MAKIVKRVAERTLFRTYTLYTHSMDEQLGWNTKFISHVTRYRYNPYQCHLQNLYKFAEKLDQCYVMFVKHKNVCDAIQFSIINSISYVVCPLNVRMEKKLVIKIEFSHLQNSLAIYVFAFCA